MLMAALAAAAASMLPSWTAPIPDPSKPLGGYSFAAGVTSYCVFNATPPTGTYNHAAMLSYNDGAFLLTWKVRQPRFLWQCFVAVWTLNPVPHGGVVAGPPQHPADRPFEFARFWCRPRPVHCAGLSTSHTQHASLWLR